VTSVQVAFGNKSTSATGKQSGSYFELSSENSRQVYKTSVNIVCSYIENLLVMQYRGLSVSSAPHVIRVKTTIRVSHKKTNLKTFFTQFNNYILQKLIKKCVLQICHNQRQIHENKGKTSMLQNANSFLRCRKMKRVSVNHFTRLKYMKLLRLLKSAVCSKICMSS